MVCKLIFMLKFGQHANTIKKYIVMPHNYQNLMTFSTGLHRASDSPSSDSSAIHYIYGAHSNGQSSHASRKTSNVIIDEGSSNSTWHDDVTDWANTWQYIEEHSMVTSAVCWDFLYKALCDSYKSLQSCFDIHMKKGKLSVLENLFLIKKHNEMWALMQL